MSKAKPSLTTAEVERVLQNHWEARVENIEVMEGGNLSSVYSFQAGDREYVPHETRICGFFFFTVQILVKS